jgi:hypothetical protein
LTTMAGDLAMAADTMVYIHIFMELCLAFVCFAK